MKKVSKILFALLLACTVSNTVAAGTLKGDVNGDNKVTVADVMVLVNVILDRSPANDACDVNDDNIITVADVMIVINIILGKMPAGSDLVDIDDDTPAWEPANAPRRSYDDIQTAGKRTPDDRLGKRADSCIMLKNE